MQQLHTHLKMSFFIFYFNFKLHVYHDNDSMHVNIYAHLYHQKLENISRQAQWWRDRNQYSASLENPWCERPLQGGRLKL